MGYLTKGITASFLMFVLLWFSFSGILNIICLYQESNRPMIASEYDKALLAYHGQNTHMYEQGGIYYIIRKGKVIRLNRTMGGAKIIP